MIESWEIIIEGARIVLFILGLIHLASFFVIDNEEDQFKARTTGLLFLILAGMG